MHYQQKRLHKSIFRAYDIRGIINNDFDENAFYSIGRAVAYRLNDLARRSIFIARDARLSSESLAKALKQGLLDSGIDTVDLGAVATPVMYYATHEHKIDSGLMVTGSHNPADYNGIKLVLAGKTLVQKDINLLYELIERKQCIQGEGKESFLDILPHYKKRLTSDIKITRRLKVVVDCGNGIAGAVIPGVFQQLGCDVIPLFCEVDGAFPNHHPDPTIESNLKDLKRAVLLHKADIGLAFDGDADRLGVISNEGNIIWPDRLLMYYAKNLLQQHKGATIVYDVKCSAHLGSLIKASGGIAMMTPTGHSIVKSLMKESKAALAGEMSGHIFFKDRWYGFDDALYSACRLLEILSQSEASVEEQFKAIPTSICTPEIKIEISEEKKFLFMDRFCDEARFESAELIRIDGLRAEFPYGFGLLRASNTSPCLVARFEADDEAHLAFIIELFKQKIAAIDKDLLLDF